ncbi:dolichol-phosphate mannosyltransferase subunit 3 [Microcaecilia unicolor]|uniref:Dolichol-phosphate mannosyltransferase subunit 3 n=1 Tax=Microcaecilia unicolor TaxID=1415580 RepID=A0A6P7WQF4_9AMPH|nr:dolichol-phosphate mannosyltransferase subunit 3 [Microcaecilia unicolor]
MTKLMEWLFGLTLLSTVWLTLSFDLLGLNLPETYQQAIWPFPIYLLLIFGCYSLATIGFRVATFNNCEDAARELQDQIQEAKKDLARRGLKF